MSATILLRLSAPERDALRLALCESMIRLSVELRAARTDLIAEHARTQIRALGGILERLTEFPSVTEEPASSRVVPPERAAMAAGSEGSIPVPSL